MIHSSSFECVIPFFTHSPSSVHFLFSPLHTHIPRHHIAKGCLEGYPVLTSLGFTGRLASVEPTTGVHIVTVPCMGIVCYLQPSSVLRPLKAAIHEDVVTPYGNGKVIRYNPTTDMYTIQLQQFGGSSGSHSNGTSTTPPLLYAMGDTFDRVSDGIVSDEEARFGVDWLLSFFFRSSSSHHKTSTTTATTTQADYNHHYSNMSASASVVTRSRSNSLVSATTSRG